MTDNPLNPIYCIHCKKLIPSGSTFCNHCGKSQASEATAPVVPLTTATVPPPPVETVTVTTPALKSPAVQAAIAQAGPNHQVVIIEQKTNHMPLILTLLALFTPVGCIIPLGILLGGAAFIAFLVGVLAFWPSALGAAVAFGIWKFAKQLPEDKRKQYALISVASGFGLNLLIFAWNSNALARHDINSGITRGEMVPLPPVETTGEPGPTGAVILSMPSRAAYPVSPPAPVYSSRPVAGDGIDRRDFIKHGDTRDVVRMERERIAQEKAIRDNVQLAEHLALADATRITDAVAKERNFNVSGTPKISKVTITDDSDEATAVCKDGAYSHSATRRGTCSGHGGVRTWL